MKNTLLIIATLVVSFSTSLSVAGTHWELAVIEKISSNIHGDIQIKVDKSASTTCDSKRVIQLPASSGKVDPLLSRAMFAYSTGEKIHIYGSGRCDGEFEIVETISRS